MNDPSPAVPEIAPDELEINEKIGLVANPPNIVP